MIVRGGPLHAIEERLRIGKDCRQHWTRVAVRRRTDRCGRNDHRKIGDDILREMRMARRQKLQALVQEMRSLEAGSKTQTVCRYSPVKRVGRVSGMVVA